MTDTNTTKAPNPLANFYRKKSVFVDLPSKGRFYESGIKLSSDGELGIMPMTNQDEIKLKSPDALYNAEAVIELFKSTVPDIENPLEIPACDRDIILLGIQYATRGQDFTVESKCPKCKTETEYVANLGAIIATAQPIPTDNSLTINDDGKTFEVFLRPYSYEAHIKSNMLDFQYARMELINNSEATVEEKSRMFADAIAQAAAMNVDVIAQAVEKIVIKGDDESEDITVTDRDHIFEWVENIDSGTHRSLTEKIDVLSDPKVDSQMKVVCTNETCKHEYTTVIDLDPQNLF